MRKARTQEGMKRAAADEGDDCETRSVRPRPATNVKQFYSKSKDDDDLGLGLKDWRKRLSNFWPCVIEIDGRKYPSVEHAFHAAKAYSSDKPEMAVHFECGGAVGVSPAAAKKAGGRAGFARHGATLDCMKWDVERDGATMAALKARAHADDEYCSILRRPKELGLYLLHFERQASKAYWGGAVDRASGEIVGVNRLGEMLMDIREGLSA